MLQIIFVSRQKLTVQLQKWMTLTTSYPNRNSITSITIRPYILNHFWKVLSLSLLCWNCFFLKSLIQESLEAENYSQRGYQRLPWIFIFKTIIRRKLSLVIILNNQLRKSPQAYDVRKKYPQEIIIAWKLFLTNVSEVVNYCEYPYFTLHPQKKSHKYLQKLLRYNEGTRGIHEYSYISCYAQRPLLGGGRAWNIFREFIFFCFQNLSVSSIFHYNYCTWSNYGKSGVLPGCYIWNAQRSKPSRWR